MPFIHIRMVGTATPAQKDEVYAGITELMQRVLGKDPAATHIVIDEVASENWAVRGQSLASRDKAG